MKGLIRNNFYSMGGNIKTSFITSAFACFVPLFDKELTIVPMVIAMQIFIFIANVGTSLHADEASKWNKYERTLPVKDHTVIGAKYISFCVLIIFGLSMGILTGIMIGLTKVMDHIDDIIWGYEYGLILSIMVSAIAYPIMLKIGTEKNELIIILSTFASIAIMFLIALVIAPFNGGMNFMSPLVSAVSLTLSPLFLFVSYLISLSIYSKKEY